MARTSPPPVEIGEFTGFPAATTQFIHSLAENNTKEWFDAHSGEYEDHWLEPARQFVSVAGEALREIAPITAEPRVNGSIFRINRDIRFTADKRPYKEYIDFWFWEGARREAVSGFYMRLTDRGVRVSAGSTRFTPDGLEAYRRAVADPETGRQFGDAVAAVRDAGLEVNPSRYKNLPRGFETADAATAELLRHDALWAGTSEPHPGVLGNKRFVRWVLNRWAKLLPLHRCLVDTLQ